MRRTSLALGVILLFAGLIVFSVSNHFNETGFELVRVEESRVEDQPYGKWETSTVFARGEKFYVGFPPPELEGVPNGGVTLILNVTDPKGGNTTFELHYRMKTGGPELNVTVKSRAAGVDVDDLDLGNYGDSPEDFGGVALLDGNYSASLRALAYFVATYYYPPDASLRYMEFLKLVPQRDYPYSQLLPVAGVLIIAGLLVSVWSVRKPRQIRRSRH